MQNGNPVPTLMYRQSDRFVRDELGRERELVWCDGCGLQKGERQFSNRMWHKRKGVRICSGCMESLQCIECGIVKRPGLFSETQVCKVKGRRCIRCIEKRKAAVKPKAQVVKGQPKAEDFKMPEPREKTTSKAEDGPERENGAAAEKEIAETKEEKAEADGEISAEVTMDAGNSDAACDQVQTLHRDSRTESD